MFQLITLQTFMATSVFNTLTNFVKNMTPGMRTLITVVLGIAGLALAASPAIKAMSAFGKKNWGEGMLFLAGAAAIAAIVVSAMVFIQNIGKGFGQDLNNAIPSAVMFAPTAYALFAIKKEQLKAKL